MEVGWWALIVSVIGVGIAAASFWRSRTPTPRWEAEVTIKTDDDGERRVTGTVANRGRGVARDVVFAPENVGLLKVIATQKATRAEFGETLTVTMVYGPEAEGDGSFLLTWSQEPRLHRRRTKRLKYALSAIPDPNTRRGRRQS